MCANAFNVIEPPGKPSSVQVAFKNLTHIAFEWVPPENNGGRNDTTYTVWYRETGSTVLVKFHSFNSTSGFISGK